MLGKEYLLEETWTKILREQTFMCKVKDENVTCYNNKMFELFTGENLDV